MKILHVTDTFLPVLGGIEVLVDDLSRNQRRRGLEATVLTATPGPSGSEVVRLSGRFAGLREAFAMVRPDVVHCHSSVLSPLAWRAAREAGAAGIPVVITMHSIVAPGGMGSLALSLATRLIPAGAAWTAVSEIAAASIQSMVPDGVPVLPNGIDVSGCRPAAVGASEEPTVVSVMRLAHRKRPLAFVGMLASMRRQLGDRPWRAVLVGDGPQARAVEKRVKAEGLIDRVTLAGRLGRDEVLEVLSRSDLYLAPSRLEAFGLAALEARCSGLPVIAMRSGGVGEFVRDGVHGYLVEGDVEMARRAADLLAEPAVLRQMAEACRRDRPDLDWNATVARSFTAYQRASAFSRPGDQAKFRVPLAI
ncbi:hypothetical protein GCM10022223_33600 [Kineosporia mesophila]|uniref:Glycosyltransferase n=1 Tax=Kineosporia mesophila TaxID=566012 RepID=A0ABP6ZPW8_9ACTN|nr:glycosyltransferase family 4 protein [Kineosporia mesophila]MCD5353655.1 glycosyltransferase family 4 protein [Kineosporia mesophila]